MLRFPRIRSRSPHWGCLPATVPSLTCPRRARTLLTTRSYRNVGAAEIEHLYSLSMGAVTNAPPDVVKSKYTCIITIGIGGIIMAGGMVNILHSLLSNAMLSSSGSKVACILSQR